MCRAARAAQTGENACTISREMRLIDSREVGTFATGGMGAATTRMAFSVRNAWDVEHANGRQTTTGGRRERVARVDAVRGRGIDLFPSFAGVCARRSPRTTRRREV